MPSISDFLTSVAKGATSAKGNMADYQHAARIFLDQTGYALSPKAGWMYYVVFSINPAAITENNWLPSKQGLEAGMLVKSCDLPKFTMQVETLNQYNRKTNIQTKINYSPVNMAFHDDQLNTTNSLWVNYFRYYYRDTWHGQNVGKGGILNRPRGYQNTKYSSTDNAASNKAADGRPGAPGAYGLNNNQSVPFFNFITIYQLNGGRFTSYSLINPLITAWNHDSMDSSAGSKFTQNTMSFAYETVFYGEGRIRRQTNPPGFGDILHYDTAPSPLSIAGGGSATVFGPGGIIAGSEDIFGASNNLLESGANANPLAAIGIGIQGANLLKNAKNINSTTLRAEGQSILNSALKGAISGSTGGIQGMLNGGAGAFGAALGFGATAGTYLVGSNFSPTRTEATPKDIVGPAPIVGTPNTIQQAPGVGPAPTATA